MDFLQKKFDVFMQFSEQQLNRADIVINLFITEGLFLPSTFSTDVKNWAWNVGSILKLRRKSVEKQTDYDPASAFLLRYQVAQLLTDLTQMEYKENEVIDRLRSMMLKAKPKVQIYFHNNDGHAVPALQFNYTLSRFTYLVFCQWIVSDSPELNRMLTELESVSPSDAQIGSEAVLTGNTIHDNYESELINIDDCIAADGNEQNRGDSIDFASQFLVNQVISPLSQKLVPGHISEPDEYSIYDLSGEITHRDHLIDEVSIDEIVSNNQLNTYSRNQYLNRLGLPDSELLSSLPTREVKLCPKCFGRSLVESKQPVNDLTTYCQTCRARVETVYGPYYYQSYTANPVIAITRHRQFLVDKLRTRYFAPEVSYVSTPSTQPIMPPASKAYFFSIAAIDEETYKGLEAKYNEFFADYSQRKPAKSVTIQICSTGGNVYQMKRMISLINSHKEYTEVVGDVLYSAAFRIYFSLICPKTLASHAVGMFHLARSVETVLESGHIVDYPTQNQSLESLEFCRAIGMTQRQIEQISAGQDIYFSQSELIRLDKPMSARIQDEC